MADELIMERYMESWSSVCDLNNEENIARQMYEKK